MTWQEVLDYLAAIPPGDARLAQERQVVSPFRCRGPSNVAFPGYALGTVGELFRPPGHNKFPAPFETPAVPTDQLVLCVDEPSEDNFGNTSWLSLGDGRVRANKTGEICDLFGGVLRETE